MGGSNPRSKMLLQIFYYSKGLLQQHNIDMKDFLRAKMSQIEGKIVNIHVQNEGGGGSKAV